MNKSIKRISFNNKKKVYKYTKELKPILKKTTTLPEERIIKSKKKIPKKNISVKSKNKKFSSYKSKKSKHFKSKKKENIKKYLVKSNVIDKNTKSPDKLVDDLFQICYKDNIKIIKYPKFKYNK